MDYFKGDFVIITNEDSLYHGYTGEIEECLFDACGFRGGSSVEYYKIKGIDSGYLPMKSSIALVGAPTKEYLDSLGEK